jgi:hypothetical protein
MMPDFFFCLFFFGAGIEPRASTRFLIMLHSGYVYAFASMVSFPEEEKVFFS